MRRSMNIHRLVFTTLALGGMAGVWWGCSATSDGDTGGGGAAPTTSSGGSGGAGGTTSSAGGLDVDGGGGDGGTAACVTTSAEAERVPLDILFLIDRSGSMSGSKWIGTKKALTTFFNDPKSIKIGAGLSYFPNFLPDSCLADGYKTLDVPIAPLPGNAFALTNSMPEDATGYGTPTYAALNGVLMAATAYQDAHPKHKVIVVLATDGDPYICEPTSITLIAELAKSARNYNGVRTYVIGVSGSILSNLDKIAVGGGTDAAYDVTNDINQFAAKMEEIRNKALGCDFEIPPPPDGEVLDPDEVNFSYTPKGMGTPKVLLRAKNLIDCAGDPGWYYDSNSAPTKIILCPASCATVQSDSEAKVDVLFGCQSQVK